MKKHGIIVLVAVMAVLLCGAVSAADSSTAEVEGLSEVNAPAEAVDPILWVTVNYEYASDDINPDIEVKDSHNAIVQYDKSPYSRNLYKLNFTYPGVTNGTLFKVTVNAPGYTTQTQNVAVNQAGPDPEFYGNAVFNMEATSNYKLGREVTKKADQLLNFATANDVLVVTTAGVTKINGETTEDCIEGILNGLNGRVTYGKGNMLMLRKSPVDPTDFAFIVKRNNSLQAVFFLNGSLNPAYQGTVSENMQAVEWNNLITKIGGENAFTYASLANAWNTGAPSDLLREAAFHGHMCQGTISGYTIAKTLQKYYPPIQETMGGPGSPGDITSYKIIGVPGDSDDDALMNYFDSTPGKGGYVGYDTTATGATANMVGFIRWKDTVYKTVTNPDGTKTYTFGPGSGTLGSGSLIVMKFNRDEIRQTFQSVTGIKLDNDLAELKFNTWVLNKIKTNPEELVTFLVEKEGLTEEQFYYIMGTATNITFPANSPTSNATNGGQVRFPMQEAHGLDMNYINSLNLPNAVRAIPSAATIGTLTEQQIEQIGVEAAKQVKQIFKTEKGIDLEKDSRNLVVLTSAGYVYFNGQLMDRTWDGLFNELGVRMSRSTLLPIHTAPWKPLWFTFVLRGADGVTMDTLYLRYNGTGFQVGNGTNNPQISDIGPKALNNSTTVSYLNSQIFVDKNYFNIQSIANAWRNDPAFDQLMTFLFHDHACPGVQPGFFISDYVFKNYPLSGDQNYYYMGSSIYCKDDSLVYLMGVSPGMGTYMNQRLMAEDTESEVIPGGTEEGLLVIWDPKTKTGKAVIINFKWATLNLTGLTTSDAQREAMISAYVSMYKGEPSPYVTQGVIAIASDERLITESEFNIIKQGGTASTTALSYVKGLPVRSLSDLLPAQGGSQTGGSTQIPKGDSGTSTGDHTGSASGSVGDSGAAVSAVTVSAAVGEEAGDSGKAYEVTQAGSEGAGNSPWGTAAIVGVIAVLALGAFGFLFKSGFLGK